MQIKKKKKIPLIKTSDPRYLLSEIASRFYKFKPKNIIAVTGTNGKTSVADLFYQILSLNNVPVASIGTLGIKYKKKFLTLISPHQKLFIFIKLLIKLRKRELKM